MYVCAFIIYMCIHVGALIRCIRACVGLSTHTHVRGYVLLQTVYKIGSRKQIHDLLRERASFPASIYLPIYVLWNLCTYLAICVSTYLSNKQSTYLNPLSCDSMNRTVRLPYLFLFLCSSLSINLSVYLYILPYLYVPMYLCIHHYYYARIWYAREVGRS